MEKIEVFRPVFWNAEKNCVTILDQTKLPHEEIWRDIRTLDECCEAITTLAVRGAPLLGVFAAFSVHIAMRNFCGDAAVLPDYLNMTIAQIAKTRPTAVNLFSALRGTQELLFKYREPSSKKFVAATLQFALELQAREDEYSRAIGAHGAELFLPNTRVLTHCNTGALAVGGIGTALGVIFTAYEQGKIEHVFVDETRPLLQGARLTAFELAHANVPYTVISDSAAAFLMNRNMIDCVIVGADRIVRNGDTANKVGTYALAICARHHSIPFYVAAPTTTFDLSIFEGREIEIEMREQCEVLHFRSESTAPTTACALNPAFDITPAALISAIITEKGIINKPCISNIANHIAQHKGFGATATTTPELD